MNAVDNEPHEFAHEWQSDFLKMLPEIQRRLDREFRHLDLDNRAEATEEGVVHSLLAFVRLHQQRRRHVATPASLAFYSARKVKHGRQAVGKINRNDVLSRYAQLSQNIAVDRNQGQWIDTLVLDKRASVPDQVMAKIDVGAWWATLAKRTKQIAKDLAVGCGTAEVAAKHGLTAGRISQLRKSLESSWIEFQRDTQRAIA